MRKQLTSLAIVITLVTLCIGNPVHSRAEQRGTTQTAAIVAIKKLGAFVKPSGSRWEVDFHLRGRSLTDAGLTQVARLEGIEWLNLGSTKITDAGLRELKGLHDLRWLHLEKTQIGDVGIEYLSDLKKLEYLNLYSTRVTNQCLKTLVTLPHLRRLYIWQTQIDETGIRFLKQRRPRLKVVQGIDLSTLPADYPKVTSLARPKVSLVWVAVSERTGAPERSENGVNCQVLFENRSKQPIKLYWISYGSGELKFYGSLMPGGTRQQNSYARNAWLITTSKDQLLGYFITGKEDALAVIPPQE